MSAAELAGSQIVGRLARFGRVLRAEGLEVGPSRIQDALLALTVVDITSRDDVYWALRCTLVSGRADIEAFDEAFDHFYEGREPLSVEEAPSVAEPPATFSGPPGGDPTTKLVDPRDSSDDDGVKDAPEDVGMAWSAVERLRQRDFAHYSKDELRRAARLAERIAAVAPMRWSRRLETGSEGHVFDKRRTLRSAMRTDGYPVACLWRQPRLVPRKLVFVVDVSGSMEPYARAMVMFLQAAVRSGRRVEAFTFGTRLTRVTRELEGRSPDQALAAATRAVPDWAGGTRIGSNLKALNDTWGRRGMTRGAVVVIVSDGWERGDIPALANEMARLRRVTHTVIWVNPVAGEPGYQPVAQGMAAALPYVDHFLPGHNLHSLEALAGVLESLPRYRRRTPR